MKPAIIIRNKKAILFSFLLILFFASAVIPPIYINSTKQNWNLYLIENLEAVQSTILKVFKQKNDQLIERSNYIRNLISPDSTDYILLDKVINEPSNVFIHHLYNENYELVYWNHEKLLVNTGYRIPTQIGQSFFTEFKLNTFFSFCDTLHISGNLLYLLTSILIERNYKPQTDPSAITSITDSLSRIVNSSVEIVFNPINKREKDGRYYSFPILNDYKNVIGNVTIEKPSLDTKIVEVTDLFKIVQSFILIIIFLFITYLLIPWFLREKRKSFKLLYITLYITFLRIFLFVIDIPTSFVKNSLTDAGNFSSIFAYGIVRSPLELFITLALVLLILLAGFKYLLEYYDNHRIKNNPIFFVVMAFIICSFFFLLIWRGLGASLRSVVFDSSIRYFKEFNLIPDAATFLMQLNILIIGFGTILISLMIFILLFSITTQNKKSKKRLLLLLFIILQLFGWLFDILQKHPQGTPLIRFIFITIVFSLLYLLLITNYRKLFKYFYIAFGASLAAVMLLTYYNSEIERESLKTTAVELTRADENIYRFMVHQALISVDDDDEIKRKLKSNEDMSSCALLVWNRSLLHNETIPVSITFYDKEKNIAGKFANTKKLFDTNTLIFNESILEDLNIEIIKNVFTNERIIKGVTKIFHENYIAGYLEINLVISEAHFGFQNIPRLLTPQRAGISSAIDIRDLNIFYIVDNKLQKYYGTYQLTEDEIKIITGSNFTNNQESWIRMKFNNEEYLVYVLAAGDSNKFISVAKEETSLTWNLSNFFKVFFVHTLLILVITILAAIWNYRRTAVFLQSYRTKLATVFLIVSIVPLVIVALYFRNITEKKNYEMINDRLTETVEQIINFLSLYSNQTNIKTNLAFEKVAQDIGADFTIYKKHNIEFSTAMYLYEPGLLQSFIPYKNYLEILEMDYNASYGINTLNGMMYQTVFRVLSIDGEQYIIEVNSLLNPINLPLTSEELDIFMFGLYSLVVILLIVFSSILANQIAYPIRKLTHATRSIGSGDLNVEVHGNYSGEIEELKNGFNMMVKKLKKSQREMAQLERETAWKEMAKQVAHEIKNPLTPMKLSVQQLIASYNDKSPKFDSIFEKVTSTIINQIETLKTIASEFSNFARMPKLNIEKIDVLSSVNDAVNLFVDEKRSITVKTDNNKIFVNADQDHFNRTIINLIRNSIQAESKNIIIELGVVNDNCVIRIIDDGIGIKPENINKVFEENFTTKTQGMGLGLSMAKKFIEHIGGDISIEKTSVNGTQMLITIPKVL